MKRKDKLSLAKKAPEQSIVAFTNPDLEALHTKFSELQETTVKLLENIEQGESTKAISAHNEYIIELNNTLVKTITVMEQSANQKELPELLQKLIDKKDPVFPKEIKTSNPTVIPKWLATDSSVKEVTLTLKKVLIGIKDLAPKSQAQTPGDFVPMRRVRMDGKRLVFDDSYYGSASGGAGSSGGTSTNDGTYAGPGLVSQKYDYLSRSLTNSTTETYVYKIGGSAGTTVATVTVVYTDTTLATISTVTRT